MTIPNTTSSSTQPSEPILNQVGFMFESSSGALFDTGPIDLAAGGNTLATVVKKPGTSNVYQIALKPGVVIGGLVAGMYKLRTYGKWVVTVPDPDYSINTGRYFAGIRKVQVI